MTTSSVSAQSLTNIQKLLEDRLPKIVEEADQYGNAGIVLKNGQTIAAATAGIRYKGSKDKVTIKDKWHIGSITKSMTATMIGRLADKGIISFDTTIEELLAPHKSQIHPDWYPVKLINLLNHTASAPANFGIKTLLTRNFADQAALDQARLDAVLDVLKSAPKYEPNTGFEYSNVGYTIAGTIAAQITGKSWETLMQEEVFTPLQLTSAGFGAPKGEQPRGHVTTLFFFTTAAAPDENADNTAIMGPAGSIHMSLQDLTKFGQTFLNMMNGNTDYLSAETAKRLLTPAQLQSTDPKYAAGWAYAPLPSPHTGEAVFHNGSNTMWYAVLTIVKDKNIVAAFATNTGTIEKSDQAFSSLLSDILTKVN